MTCLGKRNVANGRNIFGLFRRSRGENEARGLELFRSGKRNVAYGHFEAPEGAKPNMVEKIGAERRLRVSKKREGSKIDICTKGKWERPYKLL